MTDTSRRTFLGAAGAGVLAGTLGSLGLTTRGHAQMTDTLRWGIVGTGYIAGSMAPMITRADSAVLAAVSSRRLESAQAFAATHGAAQAFDSWQDMAASDVVDAIYVATPTSVREEICIAVAQNGKHVLGEKPFASLPSVRRIVAACRDNNVAFMDGTHFAHHPRTLDIKNNSRQRLGSVWSVASAFQFNLQDRRNIRYNRDLEPMGAIGDAGWYNMRAAVEYLPPGVELDSVSTHLRRDGETGAAISGAGVLDFTDGSTSTWNCGFDSGALVHDLRITGTGGVINIDDFVLTGQRDSVDFLYRSDRGNEREILSIGSSTPAAALMFEDMAAAAADPALREQWMTATERTQALLDAAWLSALESEKGA